jgi:hypothetical protein
MLRNFFSLKFIIFVLISLLGIFGVVVMIWFFIMIYLKIRKSETEET